MSQGDQAIIDGYIKDNYLNPQVTVSLLCSDPVAFSQYPFLTKEHLRTLSYENRTNGSNLQETLVFIETELKK